MINIYFILLMIFKIISAYTLSIEVNKPIINIF